MRLILFSPVTLGSAIGRVTGLVTQALKDQGHDVIVVRSEDHAYLRTPPRELSARIIPWDDEFGVRDAVQQADAVVYQVGDNYPFHRGCVEWLPRLPGIVCLHDFFVGSLFLGWAINHRSSAEGILRSWYGESVDERYFSLGGATFIERTAATTPMTEWIVSMARGVIAHSSWDIDRVLRACAGPVQVMPLPYDAPVTPSGRSHRGRAHSKFTVLTVGHVNPNKRAETVIRAIGESERLRARAQYKLVGRIEPDVEERLRTLARGLDVGLSIAGEVDDGALREALDDADVVCCLRYPALEAASASAIEAMLYGKAVVVMDTGFYRELPDDCVRKVSPEREIADLGRVLEALEADPAERNGLGDRAAEWAGRTFRADNYAQRLVHLSNAVSAVAPALDAAGYYADTLARWGATELTLATPHIVAPLQIFESRGTGLSERS